MAGGSEVAVAELLEMARGSAFNALLKGFAGDEFTKFEENGGTTEDITNHLRLHYNDKENDIFYSKFLLD